MYYKIDFKTHSMAVYGAIIKIVRRSNVVKRRITLNYDLTIKTSKDHLYDDLINALNKAGIDPSYYKLVSTPYERKAPKKRKSKRTP